VPFRLEFCQEISVVGLVCTLSDCRSHLPHPCAGSHAQMRVSNAVFTKKACA
jgi:hypothetical protein